MLQWRPIQMRTFHSNEEGLFCTHPLSVAPLFWWSKQEAQMAVLSNTNLFQGMILCIAEPDFGATFMTVGLGLVYSVGQSSVAKNQPRINHESQITMDHFISLLSSILNCTTFIEPRESTFKIVRGDCASYALQVATSIDLHVMGNSTVQFMSISVSVIARGIKCRALSKNHP